MNRGIKATLGGLCASALAFTPAYAAYLYFAKRPVRSETEANCFSFARAVAARNLANVRFAPGAEVAGTKGASYASITCVGGGGGRPATAVVMVVGDNAQEASTLRDTLANEIGRQVRFD